LTSENARFNSKFQEFKKIASDRIALSHQLINAFQQNGKSAAEQLIKNNRELVLERSLVILGQELNSIRQQDLKAVVYKVRNSGDNAKIFGYVLALFALVISILAFWYISNKIAEQQRPLSVI
jgi:CHASE3 domain sensor protein